MLGSSGSVPAVSASPRGHETAAGATRRLAGIVIDHLLDWHDRSVQRHQLRGLDDFALKDLGLSRADVEAEGRRPFWRA